MRIQVALDAAAVCEVHDVGLGEPQLPLPAVHRRHDDDAAGRRLQVDVGLGSALLKRLIRSLVNPAAMPDHSVSCCGCGAAAPDEQAAVHSETRTAAAADAPDDDGIGNGMTSWSLEPLPAETKPDYTGAQRVRRTQ